MMGKAWQTCVNLKVTQPWMRGWVAVVVLASLFEDSRHTLSLCHPSLSTAYRTPLLPAHPSQKVIASTLRCTHGSATLLLTQHDAHNTLGRLCEAVTQVWSGQHSDGQHGHLQDRRYTQDTGLLQAQLLHKYQTATAKLLRPTSRLVWHQVHTASGPVTTASSCQNNLQAGAAARCSNSPWSRSAPGL